MTEEKEVVEKIFKCMNSAEKHIVESLDTLLDQKPSAIKDKLTNELTQLRAFTNAAHAHAVAFLKGVGAGADDQELSSGGQRRKIVRNIDNPATARRNKLAALDGADLGVARARPGPKPAPELGGPFLVQQVREQEVARLRARWS
jgi:hypothetical protein